MNYTVITGTAGVLAVPDDCASYESFARLQATLNDAAAHFRFPTIRVDGILGPDSVKLASAVGGALLEPGSALGQGVLAGLTPQYLADKSDEIQVETSTALGQPRYASGTSCPSWVTAPPEKRQAIAITVAAPKASGWKVALGIASAVVVTASAVTIAIKVAHAGHKISRRYLRPALAGYRQLRPGEGAMHFGDAPRRARRAPSCRNATCAPHVNESIARRISVCLSTDPEALPEGLPITSAYRVVDYVRGLVVADRESFAVLHLDGQHRVAGVEEVARGSINGVEVHPREVFKSAILSNAAALIVVHNHPSGKPEPSGDDRNLTRRLAEAAAIFGMPILDHVVIGRTPSGQSDFYSFAEHGELG